SPTQDFQGAIYGSVGHFHEEHPTEGKVTYSDGNSFEGTFHRGRRVEGTLTYADGGVYDGRFQGPYSTSLHHSSSIVGLLTFPSDDPRRDFDGDTLALEEREKDTLPRHGKMTWKNGTSYDGTWVAGWFVRGTLRWRELTGRYPLAFCEQSSCPFYNEWNDGEYDGEFKGDKFDGRGCIYWRKGKGYNSNCYGTFKDGILDGFCHWGTVAGGWIWPHIPSGLSPDDQTLWDWPRPPQAGLRFKMDSKVSVNLGNDEWKTGSVKGFITDEYTGELTAYIVWLDRTVPRIRTITNDNDDYIREVVTDFEVRIESHPDFGFFALYYSGPIVLGKPRGLGVLTVKHSKCCHNLQPFHYGVPDHPSMALMQWPPVSYDWERDCEVEFGLDYAVRGAAREYLLQLVWSKRWFDHRYDDKSGKKEWHPLFGLIGSVLWNELEGEIDTLGDLFVEESLSPVHWGDMTSSDSDCDDEGYRNDNNDDENEEDDDDMDYYFEEGEDGDKVFTPTGSQFVTRFKRRVLPCPSLLPARLLLLALGPPAQRSAARAAGARAEARGDGGEDGGLPMWSTSLLDLSLPTLPGMAGTDRPLSTNNKICQSLSRSLVKSLHNKREIRGSLEKKAGLKLETQQWDAHKAQSAPATTPAAPSTTLDTQPAPQAAPDIVQSRTQKYFEAMTPVEAISDITQGKPLDALEVDDFRSAKSEIMFLRQFAKQYLDEFKVEVVDDDGGQRLDSQVRGAMYDKQDFSSFKKQSYEKSEDTRALIYESIKSNDLFEDDSKEELVSLIDVFKPLSHKRGDKVITRGSTGDEFYVVESGNLSIHMQVDGQDESANPTKNEVKVGDYKRGSTFGELALIYGSPRAATIIATTDVKLWTLDRETYRNLISLIRYEEHQRKREFLDSCVVSGQHFSDIFETWQIEDLTIATKIDQFKKGDVILREGELGDTMFVIRTGTVESSLKGKLQENIGEKRVIGTTSLTKGNVAPYTSTNDSGVKARGAFGKVFLAEAQDTKAKDTKAKDTKHLFALKTLTKDHICKKKQEEHVLNEFSIMKMMNEEEHPNIIRLHCAMQDNKFLYFLLDLLPGGNLMYHLKKNRKFSEATTRFYAANVVLAFEELHSLVIAYRDLKPENIVLSEKGYGVMVDFGLAKEVDDGQTYTFCGTPDYLAPEIIRGTGHDWGVDYWCLGIFLYELTNGSAPFLARNPLSRTRKILKGVEYINMPTHFSNGLIDLITSLLDNDQSKRLGRMSNGVQDIMNHRWFAGIDWEGLLKQSISAPITPDLPEDLTELGSETITSADLIPDSDWHPDLKVRPPFSWKNVTVT
ncbi:hypothetical protein THAOC_07689, partial [Thalassiosira oceanica]